MLPTGHLSGESHWRKDSREALARWFHDHGMRSFRATQVFKWLYLQQVDAFDGKGYPIGLKGEEIPFSSRIIAVADTFDAISSTRAYRSSKSSDEALAIVKEVSGSQLDPQVVAALAEIVETEGLQI